LGSATALASLRVFEDEEVLDHLPAKIDRLARHLRRIAEHANVGDVRQRGLIAAIELVKDRRAHEPLAWEEKWGLRVCQAAMRHGVWLRPLGNVLVIMPPLAIAAEEIDQIGTAVERGIEEVFIDARRPKEIS
jgi:adenosylmethionine-8-amino-7-oxononanoate aminotransferase